MNLYGYVLGDPVNHIDLSGLIEGSDANIAKRKLINALASASIDNKTWCFDCSKGNFPPKTNKCNKFVYDILNIAKAMDDWEGKWPPTAAQWANKSVNIPNWRVLKKGENPEPGDVAAYKLGRGNATGASGHSGIIIADGSGGIGGISAHADVVDVTPGQFMNDDSVTYRRYAGE